MKTFASHLNEIIEKTQSQHIMSERHNTYDIFSGPWRKVEIDIFQYRCHDYLLVAGYFSNFLLMGVLHSQMAAHVINIVKTMFSAHDILAHVFIDQGRQFTSAKF